MIPFVSEWTLETGSDLCGRLPAIISLVNATSESRQRPPAFPFVLSALWTDKNDRAESASAMAASRSDKTCGIQPGHSGI